MRFHCPFEGKPVKYILEKQNGKKKIVLTFCSFSGLGCRLLNLLLVSSTSRAPPEWRHEDQTTLPRPAIVNTVFTFLPDKQVLVRHWGKGGLSLTVLPSVLSSLGHRLILRLQAATTGTKDWVAFKMSTFSK